MAFEKVILSVSKQIQNTIDIYINLFSLLLCYNVTHFLENDGQNKGYRPIMGSLCVCVYRIYSLFLTCAFFEKQRYIVT
jgi:hypothetical protein